MEKLVEEVVEKSVEEVVEELVEEVVEEIVEEFVEEQRVCRIILKFGGTHLVSYTHLPLPPKRIV